MKWCVWQNSISQRAVQSISASKRVPAVVKAQQETSSITVLRFQSHLVVRCLIQRVFQSSEQVIELLWQSESLLWRHASEVYRGYRIHKLNKIGKNRRRQCFRKTEGDRVAIEAWLIGASYHWAAVNDNRRPMNYVGGIKEVQSHVRKPDAMERENKM